MNTDILNEGLDGAIARLENALERLRFAKTQVTTEPNTSIEYFKGVMSDLGDFVDQYRRGRLPMR
jgi:hypothetical protein